MTLAPGAGRGAPGCFVPTHASIELDAAVLTSSGIDPATCHPHRPADRDRYAPLWGVLVHECAHARHSTWEAPWPAVLSAAATAADLLEESRIERAQRLRRPGDRHWLRAAATALVMPDITELTTPPVSETPPTGMGPKTTSSDPDTDATTSSALHADPDPTASAPDEPNTPGPATSPQTTLPEDSAPPDLDPLDTPPMASPSVETPVCEDTSPVEADATPSPRTRWGAAKAAALLLGRADAGILKHSETFSLKTQIAAVLGYETLETLEVIWKGAHTTADHDGATMLALGRAWCTVLGIDPDLPDPTVIAGVPATAWPGDGNPLADIIDAIQATLAAVMAAEIPAPLPPAPPARPASDHRTEARDRTRDAARSVFDSDPSETSTRLAGTRTPTESETADARRLARALRAAGTRERVPVTTRSATPPGRLNMRGALATDAQRAAGARPTAKPFTRTVRRNVPTPPLRLGIACDVSGSMAEAAPVVASTAWILSRAVAHLTAATAATVIFGQQVRAVTRPGEVPTKVTLFEAKDYREEFSLAVDALDGILNLTRRNAARLLVIVSDGYYTHSERTQGEKRIRRLRNSGCGVLWIALNNEAGPIPGSQLLILNDPASMSQAIAHAAIDTLAKS